MCHQAPSLSRLVNPEHGGSFGPAPWVLLDAPLVITFVLMHPENSKGTSRGSASALKVGLDFAAVLSNLSS